MTALPDHPGVNAHRKPYTATKTTVLKWCLLLVLLAYVAGVTAWAHRQALSETCRGIDIRIAQGSAPDTVTAAGVAAELAAYPRKITGVPLARLDTRAIENFLTQLSSFETVECAVATDGRLTVNVVPMRPEVRVFDGNGSYYLNRSGKRMDSKASFFVDVPVVAGRFSESFPASSLLPVVRFVNADPDLKALVAMVEAHDPSNIHLVPRIQGHTVNIGDTTRLPEKRDALLAFYRKVMPYRGWDAYDTISVKFRGQVVATRRDKSRLKHGEVADDGTDLEEATLPTGDQAPPQRH